MLSLGDKENPIYKRPFPVPIPIAEDEDIKKVITGKKLSEAQWIGLEIPSHEVTGSNQESKRKNCCVLFFFYFEIKSS